MVAARLAASRWLFRMGWQWQLLPNRPWPQSPPAEFSAKAVPLLVKGRNHQP